MVGKSVGVVAEGGDGQSEEWGLLGLAADAESKTRRHHLLPLGIFEFPLLASKCLPLFWRSWNDKMEAGSWALLYLDSPGERLGRWGRELRKCIY